jgi:hypothetical protein
MYYGKRETCFFCSGARCFWCSGIGSRLMCISAFNGCGYSLEALAAHAVLKQVLDRKVS